MSSRKYYMCKQFFDKEDLSNEEKENEINFYKYFNDNFCAEYFLPENNFEYYDYDSEFGYDNFNEPYSYYSYHQYLTDSFEEINYDDPFEELNNEYVRVSDLIAFEKAWFEYTKFSSPNTLDIFIHSFSIFNYHLTQVLSQLSFDYPQFLLRIESIDLETKNYFTYHLFEQDYEPITYVFKISHNNPYLLKNLRDFLHQLFTHYIDYLYSSRDRERQLISYQYIDKIKIDYDQHDLFNEISSKHRKDILYSNNPSLNSDVDLSSIEISKKKI